MTVTGDRKTIGAGSPASGARATGFLVAADAAAFALVWLGAWWVRRRWGLATGRPLNEIEPYLTALALLLPLWLLVTAYGRHYRIEKRIDSLNDMGGILRTALMLWVGTMAAAYVFRDWSLGRSVIALAAGGMGLWLASSRTALRNWKRARAARGEGRVRAAIVGSGEPARLTAEHLGRHPDIAYEFVGFVRPRSGLAAEGEGAQWLGGSEDLERLIVEHELEEVMIAEAGLSAGEALALVDACEKARVDFKLVTEDFLRVIHNWLKVDEVGEYAVMLIPNDPLPPLSAGLKRAMDLIVSIPGLLIAVPAGLAIALAIRLDTPGPVLFVHERIGRGGRPFRMWKFRTMFADADPYAPAPEDTDDGRVTRVGRWLRKTSLDELPQLWNVIRGEMSLVGPRPEMAFIVDRYAPWQRRRLDVPPGITGLWQVAGRKRLPLHNNMEYDFYYIRNRSLLLDCAILLRTVSAVVLGKGAF